MKRKSLQEKNLYNVIWKVFEEKVENFELWDLENSRIFWLDFWSHFEYSKNIKMSE